MRVRLLFLASLIGLLALSRALADPERPAAPPAPAPPPPPWYAMFWNVENLYDTADDPEIDFADAMDPADHAEKVRRLREVVRRVNFGRGPDILGLVEVESADLVRAVAGDGYTVIFDRGGYYRGLNCGLATRLPPIGEPAFLDPGTTGRTILHAVLAAGTERLHVFVLHLKSKANRATETAETRADEEARSKEARFLRTEVDAILEAEPEANLLLLGDWNEHYRDSLFRKELLAAEFRRGSDPPSLHDADRRLVNYGAALKQSFPGGGTSYYHPDWDIFDNVLVSEPLAVRGGLSVSPYDVWIGVSFDLLDNYGQPSGFRRDVPTGASDHLPVILRIRAD